MPALIFAIGRAPLTLVEHARQRRGLPGAGACRCRCRRCTPFLVVLGFAMGIASTLTLSGVVYLAPAEAYGTALTLRMTGNRVGQIVFPALAGLRRRRDRRRRHPARRSASGLRRIRRSR